MDDPLESIHKLAFKAAEAARCAGEQGKYWEMHDRLFANQSSLEPAKPHAEAIGLDVPAFEACLNAGKYAEAVRKDMADARAASVTVAPTYFLAYTNPTGSKVTTLVRIPGAKPYADFKAQIDKLLAEQPGAAPAAKKP